MKNIQCIKQVLPIVLAICVCVVIKAETGKRKVPVTGLTLSKSAITLIGTAVDTLHAQTLPLNATNSAVLWASDDESVVLVNEYGVLTPITEGSATVTATSIDGGYMASCTVMVRPKGYVQHNGPFPPGTGMDGFPGMDMAFGPPPGGFDDFDGFDFPPGNMGNHEGIEGPGAMGGPEGMGGPGRSGSDNSDAMDPDAYVQADGEVSIVDNQYSSSTADANVVKVSGGTLTMKNCVLVKADGNTANHDGSSFYGINSAVLAQKEGKITLEGGSITTNAIGANGIVAYGGIVKVSDMRIDCAQRLSRGIHATGGGVIMAENLTINTQQANSSVIALDRGGGTVVATGGTYTANGVDCAVLYSTGDLTVNNISGSSLMGEMGVIEGDNFICINNSNLTSHADASSRGLMILQSGSGDAGTGLNGIITVSGGSLTMTKEETPLIEIVTNVTGKVTLNGVKTTIPSGILMKVDYNRRWRTYGATGVLVLSGTGIVYNGDIVVDHYSTAAVTVNKGVIWQGAMDSENTALETSIVLNGGTWTLTSDSYIDSITLLNGAIINQDGHALVCDNVTNHGGMVKP